MWEPALPCHSSEHTRELGMDTVAIPFSFRLEMKMQNYILILNTQHTSLERTWSLTNLR